MKKPNIFVYGLSNSGKDTISDYLVEWHEYMKLRIADTIKRIICESKLLSFKELEEQKRKNPALRKMHNDVSKILDEIAGFEQSSLNRVKQIINGTALDYQHIKPIFIEDIPKVICDCRTIAEAKLLLDAGWWGIFLTRTTSEYKDSSHFTEQNMFCNGQLKKLLNEYRYKQIYLIYNNDILFENTLEFEHIVESGNFNKLQHTGFATAGTKEELVNIVRNLLFENFKNN